MKLINISYRSRRFRNLVWGKNNLAEPILLQVYNWSEFRLFFLLNHPRLKGQVCPTIDSYGRRIVIFMHLSALFRIWTLTAKSISYDNNRYTTSASKHSKIVRNRLFSKKRILDKPVFAFRTLVGNNSFIFKFSKNLFLKVMLI